MSALGRSLPGIATALGILAVWEVSVSVGALELSSLPAPTRIASKLVDLVRTGELIAPLAHTVAVVLTASIIAIVLGTVVGAVLGLSGTAYRWSMASVDFFRTLPAVALLPMAVMLWGPSDKSELIVTSYAATWVMVVNAVGAISAVHPRLGDVIRVMHIGKIDGLLKVWLPAATSGLLVGARIAVVTAALTAIIAETLVNPIGLGWEIIRSQQAVQPERLWAFAFVAGLFGFVLNSTLIFAVRHLSPSGRANPAMTGA